eukprot:1960361-Pyramimonas_sp.AAC.1
MALRADHLYLPAWLLDAFFPLSARLGLRVHEVGLGWPLKESGHAACFVGSGHRPRPPTSRETQDG